jgi:hypothetical protein
VSDKRGQDYDLERVRRYFNETGIGQECPFCHANEWVVVTGKGLEPAVILLSPAGDMHIRPVHVSTYCMYCKNCGFVRQHLRSVIDKYFEDNPEPRSNGDDDQADKSGVRME